MYIMNGKLLAVLITFIGATALILSQNQGPRSHSSKLGKSSIESTMLLNLRTSTEKESFLRTLPKLKLTMPKKTRPMSKDLTSFCLDPQEYA